MPNYGNIKLNSVVDAGNGTFIPHTQEFRDGKKRVLTGTVGNGFRAYPFLMPGSKRPPDWLRKRGPGPDSNDGSSSSRKMNRVHPETKYKCCVQWGQ